MTISQGDAAQAALAAPPASEDCRTHWSQMQERGSYLGLQIMLTVYRLLGRAGFAVLLLPVMLYFFVFGASARRASRQFLARAYAQPAGREALGGPPGLAASFRHFLSFGSAILDKVGAWMGHIPLSDIDYESREILSELERSGRGAVLIASHLGNIEVCRALGSLYRNMRFNVVVHTKHADAFNRVLASTNSRATVSLFQAAEFGPDTAIELRGRVAQGEIVVIVGDRTPVSGGLRTTRVPFMGADAAFPEGPFILAALLEAPVLLMFCLKDRGRYRMAFEAFADPLLLPRRTRREALNAAVASYAARLEHYALRYPFQWFNFFDFWAPAVDKPHARGR